MSTGAVLDRLMAQRGEISSDALVGAAANGHTAIVEMLIAHGGEISSDALVGAAVNGHTAIVEILIAHGGEISSDALSKAAQQGTRLDTAVFKQAREAVKQAAQYGSRN